MTFFARKTNLSLVFLANFIINEISHNFITLLTLDIKEVRLVKENLEISFDV